MWFFFVCLLLLKNFSVIYSRNSKNKSLNYILLTLLCLIYSYSLFLYLNINGFLLFFRICLCCFSREEKRWYACLPADREFKSIVEPSEAKSLMFMLAPVGEIKGWWWCGCGTNPPGGRLFVAVVVVVDINLLNWVKFCAAIGFDAIGAAEDDDDEDEPADDENCMSIISSIVSWFPIRWF